MRKSLIICGTQLAGGFLLKKLKYFQAMSNILEFSREWENVESWLVYANIAQPYFLTNIIKQSDSSLFLLLRLTVIISLYFNETKKN